MQSEIEAVLDTVESCDTKNISKIVGEYLKYNIYKSSDVIIFAFTSNIIEYDEYGGQEDDFDVEHGYIIYIIKGNKYLTATGRSHRYYLDEGNNMRPRDAKYDYICKPDEDFVYITLPDGDFQRFNYVKPFVKEDFLLQCHISYKLANSYQETAHWVDIFFNHKDNRRHRIKGDKWVECYNIFLQSCDKARELYK